MDTTGFMMADGRTEKLLKVQGKRKYVARVQAEKNK